MGTVRGGESSGGEKDGVRELRRRGMATVFTSIATYGEGIRLRTYSDDVESDLKEGW